MLDGFFQSPEGMIVAICAAAIAAIYAHELGHYVLGYIFGGSPKFRKWQLIWPTQVDFDTPEEMSDLGVKITGGYVFFYLFVMVVGAWFHSIPVIVFGAAAGVSVSPQDLNALHYTDVWRDLTAGRSVTREDYE